MPSRRTLLVVLWVLLGLSVVSSLASTILGLTQVKSNTTTPYGTRIVGDDPCSKYPLSSHTPSRFRAASDPDWVGCGWKASDSAGRTCCGLLMTIYGIGSVVALVLVPRKWSFVLPALMILGGGVGFFAVGYWRAYST
eukprot:m51a1_g12697 hypothetical protein (138) ;mRNA; f:8-1682